MKGRGFNWEQTLDDAERVKIREKVLERKSRQRLPDNEEKHERLWRRLMALKEPAPVQRWTLPMTLAWVIWRTHGHVRSFVADDDKSLYALETTIAWDQRLNLDLFATSVGAAFEQVVERSQAGELVFFGWRHGGSEPIAIRPEHWADLRLDIQDANVLLWKRDLRLAYRDMKCEAEPVLRIWSKHDEIVPNRLSRLSAFEEWGSARGLHGRDETRTLTDTARSDTGPEIAALTAGEQEVVKAYDALVEKDEWPFKPGDQKEAIRARLRATNRSPQGNRTIERALAKVHLARHKNAD